MNKKKLIFTVSLIVMMTISSLQAQLLQRQRQLPINNREASLQQRENSQQLKNRRAEAEQQKQNAQPKWRTEMQSRQQAEQTSPRQRAEKPTSQKQQAGKEEDAKKPPLVLDVSSLKAQSGKQHKENASFTYKPVTFTANAYTDYDSLTSNSQTISTIRNQGGEHYAVGYSVSLAQGDYVDITLCSYNTNGFDAYLYLLDANYDVIAYKDDGADGLCERPYGSRLQKLIPTTGTYYIIATSYSSKSTGNFTLDITKTTAPSKTYYVDAVSGNNANDGQTPSTPLASLNAAMDSLNAVPSVGTIYVMSDILLTEELDIHYNTTLLTNGSNTYTIKRDINNLTGNVFNVYGDFYLGNATMAGQLIFDGGYDAVNDSTVYSGNCYIYVGNEGTFDIYTGITLQNNVFSPSWNYYGGSIWNEGVITMYGGQITQNGAAYGGAIYNDNGTITLNGGSIDNNMGYDYGSGIYSYEGRLTLNGGVISDVFFLDYTTLELGSSYTNTTSKQIDVYPYRRGKQVLTGNLVPDVVASFQLLNPNWGIDTEGKLDFIGTPMDVYVSNTGSDANTGTLSDPFATLYHAINVLNGVGVGTIYVMSDILDSNTAYIQSEITILPYGSNTYTIKKDLSYFTSTMFEVYGGALSLGNATMTGQLIIDGGYDELNAPTVYSGGRHIYINNDGSFDIYAGVVLQNNVIDPSWWENGGSIYNRGVISMHGGQIIQNAASYGGAIYNRDESTLTINSGSIENNTGYQIGGAIYNNENSTLTVNGGSIDSNTASNNGGGIYNENNSTVTINGGSVSSNEAQYGGGIYNFYYSTVTVNGGSIDSNTVSNNGGGIYNNDNSTLTLNGGSIDSNIASYGGGGIDNYYNSTVTVNGGSISGNETQFNGGGINNEDNSTLTMNGGSISGNEAARFGGGIGNYNSVLILNNGSIDNNTASNGGGGIDNYYNSTVTVNGGSISGNETQFNGGGINNEDNSTLTMNGGSISGNEAALYGGGIANSSTVFILSGKIENNTAATGKGIMHYSGDVSLQGAISFAGNDIATIEDGGNVSFIQMDNAITTSSPITLTPTYYDNVLDTILPVYTPCRKMVEKGSEYTFKGQDLNVFALQNVTDTILAFAADNSSINIFAAPDAAKDTNVTSCGSYTFNGVTYTGNSVGYEYTAGISCDSLTRRFIISVLPLMEESIGNISGQRDVTSKGSQTYSVANMPGASYSWKCSNSKWAISGSGSSITLDIQDAGSGTLTVQVIGECDTATRNISIDASFTGIEDHNAEENIVLYPNPATTQITITGYSADMKEIKLYSVEGKLIKTILLTDQITIIDVQDQSTGIYFLHLQDKDGRKSVKKFVKK